MSVFCLCLTLHLGIHVLAVMDEPDVLLAGLKVQISLLAFLHLQLHYALLQLAQLHPVQHQRLGQVGRHRAVNYKLNLGVRTRETTN